MAESQIAGLFMTPEMYRQQQMQADRQRAAEYAQLAPEQRAAMGFFSAGQGLGRAAGTLLGAQDPQLQRITEQQQMLQGLDVADPDSLMNAARRASEAGNVPLAMQLAGRAQEVGANAALIAQRERSNNPLQALITSGKYTPASISAFAQSNDPNDLVLATTPTRINFGEAAERKSFELFDAPFERLTPEQRALVNAALTKPATPISSGSDRDAISREMFEGKTYVELNPTQMTAVNKRLEESGVRTARAGATKVILPTSTPQDVAKFRQDVMKTIDPQLKVVTATDQALSQLDLSIRRNNPIAFNAARVQLARAIGGGGDLALKEIQNAGGDPSIAGRILDTTSTLFTSTPTVALQNQIQATLRAFKTVAANKARAELATQRDLAIRSGSNPADVDAALRFSELEQSQTPPATAPAQTGGSSAPSSTFLGSVRPSAQPAQPTPQRNVTVNY